MSPHPFFIEGPAVISFSGGRTSGYMLRQILDAGRRADVHVVFANTGKEREETLEFIEECSYRWGMPINWVERVPGGDYKDTNFTNAARDGEPFEALIREKRYLPNPLARFCTEELKINALRWFMESQGYTHWTNVVGFRGDELRRVTKTRQREAVQPDQWDSVFPLYDAKVTKPQILAYWRQSPFDLRLGPNESNCDLCFLKGVGIRRSLVRERPQAAIWWIKQEAAIGGTFRSKASPTYAQIASAQPLPIYDTESDLTEMECFCHD